MGQWCRQTSTVRTYSVVVETPEVFGDAFYRTTHPVRDAILPNGASDIHKSLFAVLFLPSL
jgi:hypothetical protein